MPTPPPQHYLTPMLHVRVFKPFLLLFWCITLIYLPQTHHRPCKGQLFVSLSLSFGSVSRMFLYQSFIYV